MLDEGLKRRPACMIGVGLGGCSIEDRVGIVVVGLKILEK